MNRTKNTWQRGEEAKLFLEKIKKSAQKVDVRMKLHLKDVANSLLTEKCESTIKKVDSMLESGVDFFFKLPSAIKPDNKWITLLAKGANDARQNRIKEIKKLEEMTSRIQNLIPYGLNVGELYQLISNLLTDKPISEIHNNLTSRIRYATNYKKVDES